MCWAAAGTGVAEGGEKDILFNMLDGVEHYSLVCHYFVWTTMHFWRGLPHFPHCCVFCCQNLFINIPLNRRWNDVVGRLYQCQKWGKLMNCSWKGQCTYKLFQIWGHNYSRSLHWLLGMPTFFLHPSCWTYCIKYTWTHVIVLSFLFLVSRKRKLLDSSKSKTHVIVLSFLFLVSRKRKLLDSSKAKRIL
jgi:hypothetical protein